MLVLMVMGLSKIAYSSNMTRYSQLTFQGLVSSLRELWIAERKGRFKEVIEGIQRGRCSIGVDKGGCRASQR